MKVNMKMNVNPNMNTNMNTITDMDIPIDLFLGVPHKQLNAYIERLVEFQRRAARAVRWFGVPVPGVPEFELEDVGRKGESESDGGEYRETELGNGQRGGSGSGSHDDGRGRERGKGGLDRVDEEGEMGTDDGQEARNVEPVLKRWDDIAQPAPSLSNDNDDAESKAQQHDTHTHDSDQTNTDPKPTILPLPQAPQVQNATMLSRHYAASIISGFIGPTTQKTYLGDVTSVKTFGWRMIKSEQMLNPRRAQAFADIDDAAVSQEKGEAVVVRLVYVPMGKGAITEFREGSKAGAEMRLRLGGEDIDTDMDTDIDMLGDGVGVSVRPRKWSFNAHEALAYSAWVCPLSLLRKDHDGERCVCRDKVKRVGVCAMLCVAYGGRIEGGLERVDRGSVLPLRLETFAWIPGSVEEVRAYAVFAREAVGAWV
ncbi:hypothetical protein K491DRAFT_735918 [Lophiostoma macrostomum CBS 122681]|uniref:Uncharacterized protein n=1 Tax=Lophiostoma macrostomum CBS 122681 TaxID=1314788 RepID=A0A6A6SPQ1_9PLEO|nr:hypothetical protein K491DRAFT_735918 [Lophiostoma macrostomum CBS 122681]